MIIFFLKKIAAAVGVPQQKNRAMAASIPLSENPTKWRMIYPVYLDKGKTIAQGRRVSQAQGVAFPSLPEIADCIKALGLPSRVEVRRI